jgi:integrator complex subunit 6
MVSFSFVFYLIKQFIFQCIESLVQKLQSGVVIHFEKTGSDPPQLPLCGDDDPLLLEGMTTALGGGGGGLVPLDLKSEVDIKAVMLRESVGGGLGHPGSRPHTPNPVIAAGGNTAWHSCRKLIYVQRSAQKGFAVGFWPLPESFWPDVNAGALPPRSAHPTLKFTCTNQEPMIIDNLPFDKYELEPSPLTLFILGRKQPNYCWQVFIQGSTKNGDTGHPFGYLKVPSIFVVVFFVSLFFRIGHEFGSIYFLERKNIGILKVSPVI